MSPATVEAAYEVVVGLEVHAQLLTRSKMFCRCSADYSGAEPNTHVCPVCLAMPGVLPVINARAVELVIMTGLALNCDIPERAKFDRKNYHYPDLMKGYQISEFDMPLCQNGYLDVEANGVRRRIRVNRVHLEEDTARLLHRSDASGEYSLLDVNRAGMPLMEIVTEPDARSPEEAVAYLTKLRQILRYLGVSHANMEEGSFRCEPNLSLRRPGAELGSKVELKNLASFRAALHGMRFEVERQTKVLDSGGRVEQETRGWRDETGETVSQRSKELAHDYRYFPEPDLPPLAVPRATVKRLKDNLPELPDARRARFESEYELSAYDANLLTDSRALADFFDRALALWRHEVSSMGETEAITGAQTAKFVANWMLGDLAKLLNEAGLKIDDPDMKLTVENFTKLLSLLQAGKITGPVAKQILQETFEKGKEVDAIVAEKGLGTIQDANVVADAVKTVLERNPKAVADYRAGKTEAVKFLLGQVMGATRGRANAAEVQSLLQAGLDRTD